MAMDRDGLQAIAAEVLGLLGGAGQVEPYSGRAGGLDLPEAYRVAAMVRQLREGRGERVAGRKIGFTNRTIWPEYGVHAPIWGYVYDRSLHDLDALGAGFSLAGLPEPRIEPEIVFHLAAAPDPAMDEAELLRCIDWVAHGFELVQSVFPGWRFAAADTIAACGLHGALLLGPRHPVAGREARWRGDLAGFDIELARDGVVVERGHAANVLDGPLAALRHLVGLLAQDGANPPLQAGEVVTTGTLTRALPVAAGERWSTRLTGIALDGIEVRLA